jgi:hypothetical protein
VIKPLLALTAVALLGVGANACGSTSSSTRSASARIGGTSSTTAPATTSGPTTSTAGIPSPGRPGTDADDGDILTKIDSNDDGEIVEYGRPATPAEKLAITTFVKHYFKAAAAGDGAALCSLTISNFAEKIPKYFSKPSTKEPYLYGKTCTEVMSRLFKHRHQLLAKEAAGFEVTGVRVNGNNGFALLAFTTMPERRYISVAREGQAWKLSEELIDGPYP